MKRLREYVRSGLPSKIAAAPTVAMWRRIEPVITRMRRIRGNSMYENFEYLAVRSALVARAHPDGCYPGGTPRMADLVDASATGLSGVPARAATEESPAPSP